MGHYERVGLWVIVGATALFTVINYASIGSLDETVGVNTAKLDQPVVRSSVLAGVPAALAEAWKTAAGTEEGGKASPGGSWITVQLANQGYGDAAVVTAELDLGQQIEQLYAVDAEGGTLNDGTYGGPSVEEGGVGEPTATVELGGMQPGETSFIFVKLPDGVPNGAAPATMRLGPAEWRSVTVTAKESRWEDEAVTSTLYGPARGGPAVEATAPKPDATAPKPDKAG